MMTVIEDMLRHHSVIVIIILFPAMLHYELLPSWHAQHIYSITVHFVERSRAAYISCTISATKFMQFPRCPLGFLEYEYA